MTAFTPLSEATWKRRAGLAVVVATLFAIAFALGYTLHPT
jgi:hypothetical protein